MEDRKDSWQAGYDDAHAEVEPNPEEQERYSYLWRLDYRLGRQVHDSFCGEH